MNAPECAENAPEPPRFVQIRWHVFPLSNLHICKKAAEEITTEVLCQFYRFYKPHVHVMYFTFEKGIPTCCVYDFYESWRAVLQFPMLSDLCFSQSNLFPYLSTKCFCECMKACWHHICIITPIFPRVQWSRKLFRACRTKCPAGLQRSAGHFEPLSYIFPSWWLANISGHSCFPCRTFYVYWTLLDKMSGMVWALCRTSAEVCRTCPACQAYSPITESSPVLFCSRFLLGILMIDHQQ